MLTVADLDAMDAMEARMDRVFQRAIPVIAEKVAEILAAEDVRTRPGQRAILREYQPTETQAIETQKGA